MGKHDRKVPRFKTHNLKIGVNLGIIWVLLKNAENNPNYDPKISFHNLISHLDSC